MLIAGAALTCSGWLLLINQSALGLSRDLQKSIMLYSLGALLLVGSNVLGLLWVSSTGIGILYLYRSRLPDLWSAVRTLWWWSVPCVLIGLLVLGIAVDSFSRGVRAASMGFSLPAFGYGLIELLGMAGLGPGRNELRTGIAEQSFWSLVPMLVGSAAGLLTVLAVATKLRSSYLIPSALVVIVPLIILMILGNLMGMRILGRHFASVLLPITLAYAFAFTEAGSRVRTTGLLLVLGLSLFASSLIIRLSVHHQKDDYATAANAANRLLNDGKTVWWVADMRGAAYYGILPSRRGTNFEFDFYAPHSRAGSGPLPDAIFLSKIEFDRHNAVRRFISTHKYRNSENLPAFSIFTRPN